MSMTIGEYNNKMNFYSKQLKTANSDKWEGLYEKISAFQRTYMEEVLSKYRIRNEATSKIYDLLCYAVRESESGNAIVDVSTRELVNEIDDILQKEIGDYLLDYEIYEEDNHWCVDCMFAGYYIPYWDGWRD